VTRTHAIFFLHRDIWRGRPGNDAFLNNRVFTHSRGVIELILLLARSHTIASDIAHVYQKSFTSSKTL
jgi:hypothetical protein